MKDRDNLLRLQLNSFHEYLSVMDQSRVREIGDMNNLKLEVDELKRANDTRTYGIQKALTQTEQMLADESDWKKISKSYEPQSIYGTYETVKPYQLDSDNPWSEGNYLRGLSSRVDLRRDAPVEDYNMRRVQSSFISGQNTGEYRERNNESEVMRKSRINDIIHELDHIMDDMNNPRYFKSPGGN